MSSLRNSIKSYISNIPNILLMFFINVVILFFYYLTGFRPLIFVSAIYLSLYHIALLVIFRNSIVFLGYGRVKIRDFLGFFRDNLKEIFKILCLCYLISILLSLAQYLFFHLLKTYFSAAQNLVLFDLVGTLFSHMQILILAILIVICFAKKQSFLEILIKFLGIIKSNAAIFFLILVAALFIEHLTIIFATKLIFLKGIENIWVEFLTAGWIMEGKISPGSFIASLMIILGDLKFLLSLPFYIFIMRLTSEKFSLQKVE